MGFIIPELPTAMNLSDMPQPLTIRVVILQDGSYWVAQCLEWDLATQGQTLQQLYERLHRLLSGQVIVSQHLGRQPFENLPPAPERYHRLWEQAPVQLVTLPDREPDLVRAEVRMASLDLRAA
jgi:hypothetical protein